MIVGFGGDLHAERAAYLRKRRPSTHRGRRCFMSSGDGPAGKPRKVLALTILGNTSHRLLRYWSPQDIVRGEEHSGYPCRNKSWASGRLRGPGLASKVQFVEAVACKANKNALAVFALHPFGSSAPPLSPPPSSRSERFTDGESKKIEDPLVFDAACELDVQFEFQYTATPTSRPTSPASASLPSIPFVPKTISR